MLPDESMPLLSLSSGRSQGSSSPPTVGLAAPAATQARIFIRVLPWICAIGGITHLVFLGLFLWARVLPLALVNVASVLVYLTCFVLARREKTEVVTLAVAAEIVVHAVVATVVLGWASGFGAYIVLALPVLVVSGVRSRIAKVMGLLFLAALYLGLDWAFRRRTPSVEVAPVVVLSLHYFNAIAVMAILSFLAGLYAYVINETQGALRELASSDSLTGLRNRRAMEDLIRYAELRLQRAPGSLSFIMCDLDRFKAINDAFGHAAGDAVLLAVSRTLAGCIRNADALSRWGGEEFLVMLADTDHGAALRVAERMRSEVEQQTVVTDSGRDVHVTMSVGVATVQSQERAERAIARADAALYHGKSYGGNRVVSATEEALAQPAAA